MICTCVKRPDRFLKPVRSAHSMIFYLDSTIVNNALIIAKLFYNQIIFINL